MKTKAAALCLASILSASAAAAASGKTDVEAVGDGTFAYHLIGLPAELSAPIKARLDGLESEKITVEGRYRTQVRRNIREGLRALGYYDATLKLKWQDGKAGLIGGAKKTLFVNVSLGSPVRIDDNRVVIEGDGADDEAFKELLNSVPKKGEVLHHGKYDEFVSNLSKTAMRRGYFDAKFKERVLAVAPQAGKAGWWIEYDTARRYRYGSVKFEGSQIDEQYLESLVPFEENAYYQSNDIAELTTRLSETGWFSSVIVSPENNREDAVVDLTASVAPRMKNSLDLGLGFSTDTGPRAKMIWKKPWINEKGRSFSFDASISGAEQIIDSTYKIPKVSDPLNEYFLLQAGIKNTDVEDTDSQSAEVLLSRYKILESGWQRILNMRVSVSKFKQGQVEDTTWLAYPGVGLSRTRSKGGLMPTWGDSQRYTLDVSSTYWGSGVDFVIFNMQQTLIRSIGEKNRFIARGQAGFIHTNDFDAVPPDLRFFAGGDRSIRGWDYKSVSPKDSKGLATGAKTLATASIEYQRKVYGSWWGAAFFDAGQAAESFNDSDVKMGAGIGVRWQSPFGPVKFDVAYPLNPDGSRKPHFYIGLGPEL